MRMIMANDYINIFAALNKIISEGIAQRRLLSMSDFAKCFCLPELFAIILSACAFIFAYVLYRALLFGFRKLAKEGVWVKLLEELRYPILLVFFEIAAVLSIQMLILPDGLLTIIERFLNVLMIATIGWSVAGIIRAFYRNYIERVTGGLGIDRSLRSMFTQVLFIYRFLIFVIIAVTIATILMTFPYIKSVGVGILGSAGIVGIAL